MKCYFLQVLKLISNRKLRTHNPRNLHAPQERRKEREGYDDVKDNKEGEGYNHSTDNKNEVEERQQIRKQNFQT